jgi:hypothetical protein
LKLAWANSSTRPYLEKPFTKIGLEWLKVKALSLSPSTSKKKEKKRKERNEEMYHLPKVLYLVVNLKREF